MLENKAIVYIRVSTEEQASSGLGIQNQKEKCLAYCMIKGWSVYKIIIDDGESAKDLYRPGIQEALNILSSGEANCLVFLKLDRLTRSIYDFGTILEECNQQNWQLVSVEENLDTSTAGGRMIINIFLTISQWEREVIAERTKAALAQKRKNMEKTGGLRPLGFGIEEVFEEDKKKKKLIHDKKEQKMIQLILKLRRDGWTLKAICRELKRRKYQTVAGTSNWNQQTISNICRRHGVVKSRKVRNDKGTKRRKNRIVSEK